MIYISENAMASESGSITMSRSGKSSFSANLWDRKMEVDSGPRLDLVDYALGEVVGITQDMNLMTNSGNGLGINDWNLQGRGNLVELLDVVEGNGPKPI